MTSPPTGKKPVVEPSPDDAHHSDVAGRALRLRIRQQRLDTCRLGIRQRLATEPGLHIFDCGESVHIGSLNDDSPRGISAHAGLCRYG